MVACGRMEPRSRRVAGSGDIDLQLLEWSEEGVPLLLLHGFGKTGLGTQARH